MRRSFREESTKCVLNHPDFVFLLIFVLFFWFRRRFGRRLILTRYLHTCSRSLTSLGQQRKKTKERKKRERERERKREKERKSNHVKRARSECARASRRKVREKAKEKERERERERGRFGGCIIPALIVPSFLICSFFFSFSSSNFSKGFSQSTFFLFLSVLLFSVLHRAKSPESIISSTEYETNKFVTLTFVTLF